MFRVVIVALDAYLRFTSYSHTFLRRYTEAKIQYKQISCGLSYINSFTPCGKHLMVHALFAFFFGGTDAMWRPFSDTLKAAPTIKHGVTARPD